MPAVLLPPPDPTTKNISSCERNELTFFHSLLPVLLLLFLSRICGNCERAKLKTLWRQRIEHGPNSLWALDRPKAPHASGLSPSTLPRPGRSHHSPHCTARVPGGRRSSWPCQRVCLMGASNGELTARRHYSSICPVLNISLLGRWNALIREEIGTMCPETTKMHWLLESNNIW